MTNKEGILLSDQIFLRLNHAFGKVLNQLLLSFVLFLFMSLCNFAGSQEIEPSIKVINSDTSGITIEFELNGLEIKQREVNNTYYHLIKYKDCSWTSEIGKPQLPTSSVFLGVPQSASISVNIINSTYSDDFGYLPLPVSDKVLEKSDGMDYIADKFVIDREFYRQNSLYPSKIADIVYEGNIRHQRTVILEIRPVQYNPALKMLRKYNKVTLRVNFSLSKLAPQSNPVIYKDEFEDGYKSLLLNYDSAKSWRTSPKSINLAPKSTTAESQSLKLFISKRGIYKLDYDMIKGSGIDPSKIDPRTLKITYKGSEVPIYVYGESDGKFDKGDYIEFFGAEAKNIYTRWNVYWLSWGGNKGVRMAQKSGTPSSSSAREVTFFKSRVRFEEDHLHHKLQHTESDQNDPDSWFESRDHWFWTGIENGSPKNEVTVKFPVYDIAQNLVKPDFKIELVGCTNFEHYVMISLNGHRVGEEAKWYSQEIYSFDGQVPIDSIKEGFDNELRLARIGTNLSDGKDMDSYPYQIYLNWFELGYYRKLMAVQDTLEFSAPEQRSSKPLASTTLEGISTLDRGRIPPELSQRLRFANITLSDKATITVLKQGNSWMLTDNQKVYLVVKESDKINVYANELNNYTISGFLNNDIEVFQISDSNAISKFKDLVIKEYKLNQEDKKRIRDIIQYNSGDTDKFSVIRIPDNAYSVTFEDDDVQNFQYIAVTSSSILKPDRIEINSPSNLRDVTNRADYIIISHPIFLESAKKLANWRSELAGGGFITKVIDVTDIYDEFNYGMVSPHAIKDFLKYAYNNWQQPAPSYVLIFADGTYDFLGIDKKIYKEAPELIGFIPSFYIKTTFGQTAVDHWYSTIDGNDGFPDIYLGRIPVGTPEEADIVVSKIIANESGRVNGEWRKQIISIADDETHAPGDEIFQEGLEEVWAKHTPVGYDTTKIYLKEIIKWFNQNPDQKRIPAEITKEMIIDAFARGAVIAQYAGHGGRHVWAHEIIFSITDIEKMRETEVYPFLLVLSCYNGYFDLPGEICMAEGMLRANKKGVIAMLSATRLTYGHGNVVLNNLLFDGIFKDKLLRIGQVTAISKTRLLKQEGLVWLTQMFEYTLFGDPASKLNIADYEANITAKSASVSSGGRLETLPTQFVKAIGGQPANINGTINASIIYPNEQKESKIINVSNGIFPATSFDIPKNIPNGSAELKLYGEIGSEYAIGGMKFMIGQPIFTNISHEITDNKAQVYVKIDNDINSAKMKSVTMEWTSNVGIKSFQMVFDQSKNAYVLQNPIDLSNQTFDTSYKIIAIDSDDNIIVSDVMNLTISSKPNLYISRDKNQNPKIAYIYSFSQQKWGINVNIENAVKSISPNSIKVMAFDKDPDRNNDGILDPDAKTIGETIINQSDWAKSKDENIQTASVFIPCSLPRGKQIVFVWVDPVLKADVSGKRLGEYEELNENDNIAYWIFEVAHSVFVNWQKSSVQSYDDVFKATAQVDAVKQDSLIAIERVEKLTLSDNQPSMSFAKTPDDAIIGYKMANPTSSEVLESPYIRFSKPISIRMWIDLMPLKDEVKKQIGLGDISDSQLDPEQLAVIEKSLKDKVSNVGIYLWFSSAKRWSRLPSNPVINADKTLMKSVQAYEIKSNKGLISSISIDENATTPIDEWNISFTDNQHFVVEGVKYGFIMKDDKPYVGTVGEEFYDPKTGIHLKIFEDERQFNSGDRLKFKTLETAIIEAESEWGGIFSLIISNDNRPPNIQINVADQNFADGNVVSSEPKINALISDNNGVDLLSHKLDILMKMDVGDFEPVDQEDYIVHFDPSSNDVVVNYAPKKLEPGNYEVKFFAYDFNGNLGMRSIKFVVKGEFEIEKNSLMNYPNPFERETDITFQLSSVADSAIVKIYTVSGRLIRTLEKQNVVNFVMIHWDGRDEDGKEVANGVYYYKLRLKRQGRDDIVQIGKMLKLK